MKLNLTGYRQNVPYSGARRVDLSAEYDAKALLDPYFSIRPPERLIKELEAFIESSKGEHIAIYFWMTHA